MSELAAAEQYQLARELARQGEFARARSLIETVAQSYRTAGDSLAALATTVGLAAVLAQSGDVVGALAVCEQAIGQLDAQQRAQQPLLARLLQNRAVCLERLGEFDAALDSYRQAAELYSLLGDAQGRATIAENEGVLLLRIGRGHDAITLFEANLALWDAGTQPRLHSIALGNLGYALMQTGRYSEALDHLEQAFALRQSAGDAKLAYMKRLDTAELYLALNLLPEAQQAFAAAAQQLADWPHERGRAQWGLGVTLQRLGAAAAAELALSEANATFAAVGDLAQQAQVALTRAALARSSADAESALALVAERNAPLQQWSAYLLLCELALADQQPARARAWLTQAQALLPQFDLPPLRQALYHLRGRLLLAEGAVDAAIAELVRAIDEVERLRGNLVHERLRISFISDKADLYQDLIALYLQQQRWQEAYAVVEQAQSRTLIDLMIAELDRRQGGQDQQEAALRAELNLLYNRLLTSGDSRVGSVAQLNERAVQLERQLAQQRLLVDRLPPAARPAPPPPLALADDTALLVYHLVHGEVVAFVRGRESLVVRRSICDVQAVERLLRRVQAHWRRFAAGMRYPAAQEQQLERALRQPLQQLYELLLLPLVDLLPPQLVIVPFGALHQVPFQALWDGSAYLLERFTVSYAPSAAIYAHCQRRPRTAQSLAVLGISKDLDGVEREVQQISDIVAAARLLLDDAATIAAFHRAAGQNDRLHIACHAVFRQDNPMYSALQLADGWLTASDIAQMKLPPGIVALSACETASSGVAGGDEIVGLARAFFAAGTATLVASQWMVDDGVTSELMPAWYRMMAAGELPAAALRRAQLEVRAARPHPYFWAAFILMGQR